MPALSQAATAAWQRLTTGLWLPTQLDQHFGTKTSFNELLVFTAAYVGVGARAHQGSHALYRQVHLMLSQPPLLAELLLRCAEDSEPGPAMATRQLMQVFLIAVEGNWFGGMLATLDVPCGMQPWLCKAPVEKLLQVLHGMLHGMQHPGQAPELIVDCDGCGRSERLPLRKDQRPCAAKTVKASI